MTGPRSKVVAKREELLDAAGAVLARTGVAETSMASLAAAMGTSGRMLAYYFGSKERFTRAVIRHQRMALIAPMSAVKPAVSVGAQRQRFLQEWHRCTRGERSDTLRTILQVFGAACGRNSPYRDDTRETLSAFTRNMQAQLMALGMPTRIAEVRSDIAVATFQGFVIDYFTSDDPGTVDATFRRFVDDFVLAPFESAEPTVRRTPTVLAFFS